MSSKSLGQTAYETFAAGGAFFASPSDTLASSKQNQAGAWAKLPEHLRELWERSVVEAAK